jgi:hypothetical protein
MRRDLRVALVDRRLLEPFQLGGVHRFHGLEVFRVPAIALGGGGNDDQVAHHFGMLDRHADRSIAAVRIARDIGLRDVQMP